MYQLAFIREWEQTNLRHWCYFSALLSRIGSADPRDTGEVFFFLFIFIYFFSYLWIKEARVQFWGWVVLSQGSNRRLIGPVMSSPECPSLLRLCRPPLRRPPCDGWLRTSFTPLKEKWRGCHSREGRGVRRHDVSLRCDVLFCIFLCHPWPTVTVVPFCSLFLREYGTLNTLPWSYLKELCFGFDLEDWPALIQSGRCRTLANASDEMQMAAVASFERRSMLISLKLVKDIGRWSIITMDWGNFPMQNPTKCKKLLQKVREREGKKNKWLC